MGIKDIGNIKVCNNKKIFVNVYLIFIIICKWLENIIIELNIILYNNFISRVYL